jgi:hypothetical protein
MEIEHEMGWNKFLFCMISWYHGNIVDLKRVHDLITVSRRNVKNLTIDLFPNTAVEAFSLHLLVIENAYIFCTLKGR